jgi:hypothetical protein
VITFRNEHQPLKDLDSVSLAAKLRAYFELRFPVRYTERLNDAIQVASYLHRTDVRRGGRGGMPNPPYIEHPLRVALRLTALGVKDVDTYLAAVLHDTVEDHAFEFADFDGVPRSATEQEARTAAFNFIGSKFGYTTAAIVDAVSNPILPEGISKADKVKQYQEHVEKIALRSESSRIVKFSDFVDNAGSLHHHYEYDDPKAKYFIDRYMPLIPLYREVFDKDAVFYNPSYARNRLRDVEAQFAKFQAGLDIPLTTS